MSAPELPRVTPDTTYHAPTGRTIRVAAGANLQTALNGAQPGDAIELEAGATWQGAFKLNTRADGAPVTIRSSAYAQLPERRVGPADAAAMPKILATTGQGALQAPTGGTGNVRFDGVEFGIAPAFTTTQYGIITLGDGAALTPDAVPTGFVFDRVLIRGVDTTEELRGIVCNTRSFALTRSNISGILSNHYDSQAVCGWNGPGPFLISDTYAEGAGENIMFGGSPSKAPSMVPQDITLRQSRLAKPTEWRAIGAALVLKNILELKSAWRVLVEGCEFDGSWGTDQYGVGIVFKSANPGGDAVWGNTDDVTLRDSRILNTEEGIHLIAFSIPTGVTPVPPPTTDPTQMIKLENVVFENLTGKRAIYISGIAYRDAAGALLAFRGVDDVTINQCTYNNVNTGTGTLITFSGHSGTTYAQSNRLRFTNNVAGHGRYGFFGDGDVNPRLFAPDMVCEGNTIVGAPSTQRAEYGASNTFVANWTDALVDPANGDYHRKGTAGADVDAIAAALLPPVDAPAPTPDEALAAAQARCVELEAEVTALNASLVAKQAQIDDLETGIAARDADIAARQAQIDQLRTAVAAAMAALGGVS